jgi:hypothetical protein
MCWAGLSPSTQEFDFKHCAMPVVDCDRFLQTNFGLEACRRDPTEVSSYIVKAKLLTDEQRQCMAAGGQPCSQQQQALPQLPSTAPMQQHTQAGQPAGAMHGAPGGVLVQGSMWVAAPQQQQQSQQQPVMLVPASSSCASAAFTSNSGSSNSSDTLTSYFLPGHQQQQEGMLSAGLCAATAGLPTTVLQAPLASAPQLQGGHFPAVLGPAASSSSCLISTQTGLQIGSVMPAGADAVLLQPQTAGGPPQAWQQQQQTGFYQTLYPGPAQQQAQQPQLLLQSGGCPAGSSYAVWQPCSPAVNLGEPTSFTVAQQQVSTTAVTPLEQQLMGLSLAGGLQQNVSQFAPMQHTML